MNNYKIYPYFTFEMFRFIRKYISFFLNYRLCVQFECKDLDPVWGLEEYEDFF